MVGIGLMVWAFVAFNVMTDNTDFSNTHPDVRVERDWNTLNK